MAAQGLWNIGGFNLPDFGISEKLGIGPQNAAVSPSYGKLGNQGNTFTPSPGTTYGNAPVSVNTSGAGFVGGSAPAPTGGGGGGGTSRLSQLTAPGYQLNPWEQSELSALQEQQRKAWEASYEGQLSRANTQFDYTRSQLEGQLPNLLSQKENAIAGIETGLSGVKTQAESSRANSKKNTETQVQQAGSIAQSTQDQNRRVLRALGIINSTAAGELLTKPMNEFDEQRGNLQEIFIQRSNELDQFIDQKSAEANNAKNDIISQYTNAYNNIQNDLRFSERQRLDAIQAINAQAQQHLADIQMNMLNFQNQVNAQKQNFAQGLMQMAAYQDPTIAKDYLNQFLLSNTGQGNQTVGITQKKQNAFGL